MPDTCGNPLLLQWVKELLDKSIERGYSKGTTIYRKAYNSIKACPITFTHPAEAMCLQFVGPKICKILTEKYEAYCQENGIPMPKMPKGKKRARASGNDDDEDDGEDEASSPKKKKVSTKAYVPQLRSGGYGIIIALSTLAEDSRVGITKQQVINLAEPHCDSSYTVPGHTNKFYTAWKSMDTLIDRFLVYRTGKPQRYCLTEEGWDVAKRMKNASNAEADPASPSKAKRTTATSNPTKRSEMSAKDNDGDDDPFISIDSSPIRPARISGASPSRPDLQGLLDTIPDGAPIDSTSALPDFEPITLPPGSFTVQLVLDNREVRAKTDRDYVQIELTKKGVIHMTRGLELGDVMWVAKLKDPALLSRYGAEGDEIILDYIVERKRLDDLIGSIKDGRFREQKFRLRRSGIKNVIYIIEEHAVNSEKYEEAVASAIASTQVVNGYFVKKTQKLDDSIKYLARLSKMLKQAYEGKELKVIPTRVITTNNYLPLLAHLRKTRPAEGYYVTYEAFASLSSKSDSLTLRDVFLKMLMCIKGVTGEKALEIQKRWKTPRDFLEAFAQCGSGEDGRKKRMEMVAKEMSGLVGKGKIQKALSVRIAEIWGDVQVS